MNYCSDRLLTLKIDESTNRHTNMDNPSYAYQYFQPDLHDNIRINYYDLRGYPYTYHKPGNKFPVEYYRTRLKNPKGDMKYMQPKKSPVLPYFTPIVIDQYINRRTINTLYFTEGEFKAFKLATNGLPVIGFPSIHGAYDNHIEKTFHADILKVITECKVKNLVFITDADTFAIKYDPEKELSKRGASFYSAIKNFYEVALPAVENKALELQHLYWCHIRTHFNEAAKGIDDLLMTFERDTKKILRELQTLQFAEFFEGYLLNDTRIKSLQKTFGLTCAKDFYEAYKPFIGSREFRYGRNRYQWDGENLMRLRHDDADNYFRIGADWYKMITVPSAKGSQDERMISYKISEIQRDYSKKYPDFIDQCHRFDSFCNVPSINGSYKRVLNNCYNLFHPIRHDIKEGTVEKTLQYLKHLFDNKNMVRTYRFCDVATRQEHEHTLYCQQIGDQFNVALDWLSILFQHPTQKVPVPCLVSTLEGTGKTTFLKWLKLIFGSNATILDKSRFEMSFNSHFATKFIIGLDEGFLEVDKKAEKERLKQLVTSDTIFLEHKGTDVKEVDFWGKLIICSNDADRLMKVDENDSRWFVVNVPKFTTENPFLLSQLEEEIPAAIHFLLYRDIFHPNKSRLWFKKEWFVTDQLQAIIEATRNRLDQTIDEFIKDLFITYRWLRMDLELDWILENIKKDSKYRLAKSDVKDYLKKRKNIIPSQKAVRAKMPIGFEDHHTEEQPSILTYEKVCKPYTFFIEDWLDEQELAIDKDLNKKQEINDISAPF